MLLVRARTSIGSLTLTGPRMAQLWIIYDLQQPDFTDAFGANQLYTSKDNTLIYDLWRAGRSKKDFGETEP